ncbi:hypothetical protein ACRALDRAFT_1079003 [Sodiomyces alcalophilus JCM 7366]|uniref:uncharacterized protein n=1 Tax=Sodiomyces alcalophilus JCM 7366 TaxID=591952 RepID=UPI0039B3D861
MATLPPNSLLARSRSLRSTNTNTTTSQSTAILNPITPATITRASNISVFLTNLRLLDLDSYPDWPGFDAQTFSIQKKRIQSVEWALYQLFVLWDPEEAQTKLAPYFPPRDQVQSLNLRAALLKCLEQAKKNGVLGRDAVVRKTMLDECKGERLEEVLAAFSSAVLKKLAAAATEAEGDHPAVAQQLALENRGYSDDRTELVALTLAHRVSLGNLLRRKDEARKQYRDLSELLDVKERNIARRREQARVRKETATGAADVEITEDIRLDTWRMVRNNWAGNERWMETLLQGDANARTDSVLGSPFDRVWRRVQADRLSELEDEGKGLLEQLDHRVKVQQESLQKRRDLHRKMCGHENGGAAPPEKEPTEERKRGIDLGFNAHENLHLGRMGPKKQLITQTQTLIPEYTALLENCKKELSEAGQTKVKDFKLPLAPRTRQPTRPQITPPAAKGLEEDAMSDWSDIEEPPVQTYPTQEPAAETGLRQISERGVTLTRGLSRQGSLKRPVLKRIPSPGSNDPPSAPLSQHPPQPSGATQPYASRSPVRSPERKPRPSVVIESQEMDEPPSPAPPSPTQQLADEILASVTNASPSPVKQPKPRHTLSLAERTRLSMARLSRGGKPFDLEDEDETIPPIPRTPGANASPSPTDATAAATNADSAAEGVYEDLAARTRRSMAGFEAARQKAQLERRRSQRRSKMAPPRREGSYFPKVDEEGGGGDGDTSVLATELMEQGAEDVEAVFRSRPKLQTSPLPSPGGTWAQYEYD